MLIRAGYALPERPAFVGLRNAADPGDWNDAVCVVGPDVFMAVQGTCDPGRAPMEGTGRIAVNRKGVARVMLGHYRDALYPGYHGHKKAHPAPRQSPDVPFPVERWDGDTWVAHAPTVGPFNLHRASWSGSAQRVGDYSHGCIVVRRRQEHWRLILTAGYPEHGPTDADCDTRWDLFLLEWR